MADHVFLKVDNAGECLISNGALINSLLNISQKWIPVGCKDVFFANRHENKNGREYHQFGCPVAFAKLPFSNTWIPAGSWLIKLMVWVDHEKQSEIDGVQKCGHHPKQLIMANYC